MGKQAQPQAIHGVAERRASGKPPASLVKSRIGLRLSQLIEFSEFKAQKEDVVRALTVAHAKFLLMNVTS